MRLPSLERYATDPMFASVVDVLYSLLCDSGNDWTPTELREAAMLAALKFEMYHVQPLIVSRDGDILPKR